MISRRLLLQSAVSASALWAASEARPLLEEFSYGDVTLMPGLAQTQFEHTQRVILSLNEDSLLKPWRLRAGLPAPGPDLGGWYDESAAGEDCQRRPRLRSRAQLWAAASDQ